MAHPLVPRHRGGSAIDALLADHLAAKARKTVEAYGSDLRAFARFVEAADVTEAMTRLLATARGDAIVVVLRWRTAMLEAGYAPNTINRRLAALRKVVKVQNCGWTLDVEGIPVQGLRDTRGPGVAVIRDLLGAAEADESILGYRDAAILQWMFYLALRRVEVVRLEVGDFSPGELASAMVRRKGKRSKSALPVDPRAARATLRWLTEAGSPVSGPLFIGTRGRKGRSALDPATINRIVRRRAEQAGYLRGRLPKPDDRPITPHGFRHSAITALIEAGGTMLEAQELAGHASPQTTQIYFDNVGQAVRAAQSRLPDLK